MGLIGGGPGAFIGPVHRLAAEMDRRIELVAGAFFLRPRALPCCGAGLWHRSGASLPVDRGHDRSGARARRRYRPLLRAKPPNSQGPVVRSGSVPSKTYGCAVGQPC